MAKRPSLVKQVKDVLDSLARFGESKHEEKEKKAVEARASGAKGWNPARVDGVYSIVTMQTYRRECIAFVEWAKINYDCRYLEQCKTYAGQYLVNKIASGNSAWSVQTIRSALRKLYQNQDLAGNVQVPN